MMNYLKIGLRSICGIATMASVSAEEVGLDQLELSQVETGWGTVQAGKSVSGQEMRMGEKIYQRGIGLHSPGKIGVQLDGKAERFKAVLGVNQKGGNEVGTVEFVLMGDGKKLYQSGVISSTDAPKDVDVSLKGVKFLQILVTDGGDNNHSDHANLADATITYAGAKPKLVKAGEAVVSGYEPESFYPKKEALVASKGNTTWYVDPEKGDDQASGKAEGKAWKSLSKVNGVHLQAGDRVVIKPGVHDVSLKPTATGTAAKPVVIEFLPGVHEIAKEQALSRPWFISNSCDAPKDPKPVGILVEGCEHLRIQGGGAKGTKQSLILMGGRMIEVINHRSEHITYQDLAIDLKRPTVSEFRVMEVEDKGAVIQVAERSTYSIQDGKFSWTGDWGKGRMLCQLATPAEGRCWRGGGDPFAKAVATDLGDGKVRLTYSQGNGDLVQGRQHHFRLCTRDSVGIHNSRSKDISFIRCDIYALTNMGVVSQFTDTLTFKEVRIIPPEGTIRTCPGWADALHFSGCKGDILIEGCKVSGLQDDPVNVHGTHLRVINKVGENQLHLRFMHPQTYGFEAFQAGDEVAVINHNNLREYAGNPRRKVTKLEPLPGDQSGKEWLLSLDGAAPEFHDNDVIDNVTWYPNVTLKKNYVDMIPTRGFLLTTRGKVVVEDNTFFRCSMPGILIEDDANGWFESGPIQDLVIRNNKFIQCGIEIDPKTKSRSVDEPVHQNIRIEGNYFEKAGISARNTKGLVVKGNRSPDGQIKTHFDASCGAVVNEDNQGKASE